MRKDKKHRRSYAEVSILTEPWLFKCGISGCENKVSIFDHYFPYFSSKNRCEEHKNLS